MRTQRRHGVPFRGILIALTFTGLLAVAGAAVAQDGLAMMKVEAGARASGMAGAFASIPADPYSAVYNPAGAVDLTNFTVSFGHNEYWDNIRIETGYFASPLRGRMYIHGGIRFAGLGNIEVRQTPTSEPEAYADAHDISFKAGLAYRFSEKVAAGFGLGWLGEKIEAYRGGAISADLGVLGRPRPNLKVGASVTNIGSSFTLSKPGVTDSRKISLPTTYRVGTSYQYQKYLGAADLVVLDDQIHLHLGAEGHIQQYFFVRAGYMFNYDTKNFTAGATFVHRNVKIDYAFVPYSNDLGNSHLFNITFEL